MQTRIISDHVYIMGDWNGCLQIREDQKKVSHRVPRLTTGDTCLQNFVRTYPLLYPTTRMNVPFNILEHFTHESHYVESSTGQHIDFYRVTDCIFASTLHGIVEYTIDSFYNLIANPSETLQGSVYIGHNVVSLKIDLTTLCQGKILQFRIPINLLFQRCHRNMDFQKLTRREGES
jgi:hypothetical protein